MSWLRFLPYRLHLSNKQKVSAINNPDGERESWLYHKQKQIVNFLDSSTPSTHQISTIPEAEREASEVLHSLLPVERIERKEDIETVQEIENCSDDFDFIDDEALSRRKANEHSHVVKLRLFSHWFESILRLSIQHENPFQNIRQQQQLEQQQDDEYGEIVDVEFSDTDASDGEKLTHKLAFASSNRQDDGGGQSSGQQNRKSNKKTARTKARDNGNANSDEEDSPTKLESSVGEVSKRLAAGCECQGVCFKGLQAESVYRHRLNIAELTKQEHDMYLMGVTMAVLSNRSETNRHKERIRQRAVYVFQGKRVCLDAFVYLENVTQYHLKRIRRHVMVNGVTPRVHGNVRKKPHNALSLDVYKFAENFVKTALSHYTNDLNKSIIVVNEPRINIYHKFRTNCPVNTKTMSYSTFRHFLKKQFPHVRFVIGKPMDTTKFVKQEKKPMAKIKFETDMAAKSRIPIDDDQQQIYTIQTVGDGTHLVNSIKHLDEAEATEMCVEFIDHEDDSYESGDGNEFHELKPAESPELKVNEYQDVDFLEESEDD